MHFRERGDLEVMWRIYIRQGRILYLHGQIGLPVMRAYGPIMLRVSHGLLQRVAICR